MTEPLKIPEAALTRQRTLISEAQGHWQLLQRAYKKAPSTLRNEIHVLKSALQSRKDDLSELNNATKAKDAMERLVIAEAVPQRADWSSLSLEKKVAHARHHVEEKLIATNKEAKAYIETSAIARLLNKRKSSRVKEDAEKEGGFLKNLMEKHEKWIGEKTDTTRMTIANLEIFVGSIAAIEGLVWTFRALKGEKVDFNQETQKIEVTKMSPQERVLKAALAVGTTAAGVGLSAFGFSAFNRH
jgi:hypothetical protein